MSLARFLQIHYLTAFPGTLLNRDDAGMAKRLPFGGHSRTRISSQCLKRHWRTAEGEDALRGLGTGLAVRSRETFERLVLAPLVKEGLDDGILRIILEGLRDEVLGKSAKAKKKGKGEGEEDGDAQSHQSLATGQVVVLGRPEIEFILSEAKRLTLASESPSEAKKVVAAYVKDKNNKKNFAALAGKGGSAGVDGAMFGRMVTSDILARSDAAVHVAHAFTVHAEESESDYFSAVDDLASDDHALGSGHINETELTTGLFYGYVVIDLPGLVSNLTGCTAEDWETADRGLAAQVVERFLGLVATVSPGAKRGSTAPYSYANFLMVESGSRQPRTLANAFLDPVPAVSGSGLIAAAQGSLTSHLLDLDRVYGAREERRYITLAPVPEEFPGQDSGQLETLQGWAGSRLQ